MDLEEGIEKALAARSDRHLITESELKDAIAAAVSTLPPHTQAVMQGEIAGMAKRLLERNCVAVPVQEEKKPEKETSHHFTRFSLISKPPSEWIEDVIRINDSFLFRDALLVLAGRKEHVPAELVSRLTEAALNSVDKSSGPDLASCVAVVLQPK